MDSWIQGRVKLRENTAPSAATLYGVQGILEPSAMKKYIHFF
jgi:hypothetical protein